MRTEPLDEAEKLLTYLTVVIGSTIIKSYPTPVNAKVPFTTNTSVIIRFTDDKRKASNCIPMFRIITYSVRDINKCKEFDDLVKLAVHECCHFIYTGHKKEYWINYYIWYEAAKKCFGEYISEDGINELQGMAGS